MLWCDASVNLIYFVHLGDMDRRIFYSLHNIYIYIYIYSIVFLDVGMPLLESKLLSLCLCLCIYMFRFICTFLTKAACCRNIEIVLHPTILSIYIYIVDYH